MLTFRLNIRNISYRRELWKKNNMNGSAFALDRAAHSMQRDLDTLDTHWSWFYRGFYENINQNMW